MVYQSNTKNTIGIVRMGSYDRDKRLRPTSDLNKILLNLQHDSVLCGALEFREGITSAMSDLSLDKTSKRKRILVFTGGHIHLFDEEIDELAELVKESGVTVDVVGLWLEEGYEKSKRAVDRFVDAVYPVYDIDRLSHIKHFIVEPSTKCDDIISRTREIFSLEEGEIARNEKGGKDDEKGKNQAHDVCVKAPHKWKEARNKKAKDDEHVVKAWNRSSKKEHVKAWGMEHGAGTSEQIQKRKNQGHGKHNPSAAGTSEQVQKRNNQERGEHSGEHNYPKLQNPFEALLLLAS